MSSAAASRWEAPEPVDPPSLDKVHALGDALVERTGVRLAGWLSLALGILALVMGLVLGWLELKVVGVMAITLVLVSLLWTIVRPRFDVRIAVPERSVMVGTRVRGEVRVRNIAARQHIGSRLNLPVGTGVASFIVPSLGPERSMEQQFRVPTSRRGVVMIGPAESIAGDPLALTGRSTRWTAEITFFVHPETIALPGRQSGFVHDLEGHASSHLSSADMNFQALRPYAPGDDRRHVHWRSTARTGSLMVRQFEESRMSRVAVSLDTGRLAWLDDDEFELGVSCAGSVAVQTLLGGTPLSLRTSTSRLATHTPSKALDELAGVALSVGGGVVDLVHTTRREEPGASVAVFVTGSSASTTQVRRAGALFDVDTRVIGIRAVEDGDLHVRAAGNVSVITVGRLDDLPRGIRRAME